MRTKVRFLSILGFCGILLGAVGGMPAVAEDTPAPCPIVFTDYAMLVDIAWVVLDANQDGVFVASELRPWLDIPFDDPDMVNEVVYTIISMLDINGGGRVTRSEMISQLPILAPALSSDPVGSIDSNGDGYVQYSEVANFVSQAQFDLMDRNANGVLDCGDAVPEATYCALPESEPLLVSFAFPVVDLNHNGTVSIDEVRAVVPAIDDILNDAELGMTFEDFFVGVAPYGEASESTLNMLLAVFGVSLVYDLDENENRVFEYSELSSYLTQAQFNALDVNGNGHIDCEDLPEQPAEGEGQPEGTPYEGYFEGFYEGYYEGYYEGGSYEGFPEGDGEPPLCRLPNDTIILMLYVLDRIDTDNDDGVTAAEFLAVYPNIDQVLSENVGLDFHLDDVYALTDKNGDGKISFVEIQESAFYDVLASVDLLDSFDANGDGVLLYSEVSEDIPESLFDLLDTNQNDILECNDLTILPPVEGEAEGTPEGTVEGEGEQGPEGAAEGEGEQTPCGLPDNTIVLLAYALDRIDANNDDGVSVAEFLAVYPDINTVLADMLSPNFQLEGLYGIADANRDGNLTFTEIQSCSLFDIIEGVSLLDIIDMNGDGIVYYMEVADFIPFGLFGLLDYNGNSMLDCGDLSGISPTEGETEGGDTPVYCTLPNEAAPIVDTIWRVNDLGIDDAADMVMLAQFLPPWALSEVAQWAGTDQLLSRDEALAMAAELFSFARWQDIDMNRDGGLQYQEVALWMEIPQMFFNALDSNDNEVLDCEDIQALEPEPCAIPYDTKLILRWLWPFVDVNDDGVIVLSELQAVNGSITEEMFATVDFDGDGELRIADIDVLAQIAAALDVIGMVDITRDGLVSFGEVNRYIGRLDFERLDSNANGVLDCKDVIVPKPPINPVLAPCEMIKLIEPLWVLMDTNNDGTFSLEELGPPPSGSTSSTVGQDGVLVENIVPAFMIFFVAIDLNGDRQVTKSEMAAFKAQCDDGNEPVLPADPVATALRLSEIFDIVDANDDGRVSLREVSMYFQTSRVVFRFIDADGSGFITVSELEALIDTDIALGGDDEPLLTLTRIVQGNGSYAPGEVLTVSVEIAQTRIGALSSLGLSETLPEGWTFAEVVESAGAQSVPQAGDSGKIEFVWLAIPGFPTRIVYRVNVPESASGIQMISGQALFRTATSTELTTGMVETAMMQGVGAEWAHTADTNRDWAISLSEMLRVIQFFNLDGYHCESETEDGFAPGTMEDAQGCAPHGSDYMTQDWVIDLSELLRLIQLFNAPGRAYYYQAGTEDGFAPVLYDRR